MKEVNVLRFLQERSIPEAKEESNSNAIKIIFSTIDKKTGEVRDCTPEEKAEFEKWGK